MQVMSDSADFVQSNVKDLLCSLVFQVNVKVTSLKWQILKISITLTTRYNLSTPTFPMAAEQDVHAVLPYSHTGPGGPFILFYRCIHTAARGTSQKLEFTFENVTDLSIIHFSKDN